MLDVEISVDETSRFDAAEDQGRKVESLRHSIRPEVAASPAFALNSPHRPIPNKRQEIHELHSMLLSEDLPLISAGSRLSAERLTTIMTGSIADPSRVIQCQNSLAHGRHSDVDHVTMLDELNPRFPIPLDQFRRFAHYESGLPVDWSRPDCFLRLRHKTGLVG